MSDEDAFLDGIAADRADRTRLLVFADWLADRDDPREEFVRVHAQLQDMDGNEAEFEEAERHWAAWTGGIPFVSHGAPRLSAHWLDALCRVCTTTNVEEYSANGRDPEPQRCESFEFGHLDQLHPGREASLTLYHGRPDAYESPFEFVSDTLLVDLWEDPFLARGAQSLGGCAPVTRGRFWKEWNACTSALRKPPPQPVVAADNHFLGAQYVFGDWNNWGLVAVYRHDYFALYWSTTA